LAVVFLCFIAAKSSFAADFMSQTEVAPIYAAQLGPLNHPADLPKIYAAHLLIEQYFTSPTAADRKAVVTQLEATNLDINLIGRLIRLHLGWATLTAGVYYINQQVGRYPVKYFLGVPKTYRRDTNWPLVVKLPTPDAFLTDPPPDADQVVKIYTQWVNDELSAHPDALVIMPLLNLKELYGPSYAGMNSVIQPILDATARVAIDPRLVYLIGHSMAAHAAWNIALHYPTYFAAINPLAGGAQYDWQRLRLPNLRNVLPVVWADTDDQVVPVNQSADLVDALRKLKIDVDYTQTSGVGHLPPPDVAEQCYQKLRARPRDLYPNHVSLQSDRPDSIFNRADWIQVYDELDTGDDVLIRLEHGTGPIRVYRNPFTLDAVLDNNIVTLSTKNVDSLRLYFNEHMIDFTKPLIVLINGKERFHALLKPSMEEMMKDQLILGRGWRHYSAVADIDMEAILNAPRKPAATAGAGATSRPKGHITVYNDDGSVQKVIETP
jgi:pimeloyl-ACP methyl ester carboxylesterase